MYENPYASPPVIAEELDEEGRFKLRLRRTERGIVSFFCGSLMINAAIAVIILDMNDYHLSRQVPRQVLEILWWVFICGPLVTWVAGLVCCLFCPGSLVKRVWLYVVGHVGLLAGMIVIPMTFDYELLPTLVLLSFTGSGMIGLLFLLRLAHGLESTPGVRLAWGLFIIFGLLMTGTFVLYYITELWQGFEWENRETIDRLIAVMISACGIVYSVPLETLRRRITWMLAE